MTTPSLSRFLSPNGHLLGRREDRANALIDAYCDPSLSPDELKLACKVAYLHTQRLGGLHSPNEVGALARVYAAATFTG